MRGLPRAASVPGQVQFAAFKQVRDDTTGEKKRAIAEANEMIEVLKADIRNTQLALLASVKR